MVPQADNIGEMKKYLAEEFAMDAEEITEMLDVFFDSMRELLSAAKTQLAQSATTQLSDTGHAIKGSAASINAVGISELGRTLEKAGAANDLPTCKEAITNLDNAIARLNSDYQK